MKSGIELIRNGVLAVMFGLGAIGLTACGDEGDDAVPGAPAEMDDGNGYDYDDARDDAEDAYEDSRDATKDAYEDTKDATKDAYEDMKDEAEDAYDDSTDAADDAADDMEDASEDAADRMKMD